MSGRNIISKELADSIRQCLGRKVKLSLRALVKFETKSDKTENRVLAFALCRLFVLTAKVPTRVDQHFHYLDVQGIESRKPNQLCLTVCDRTYTYYTTGDDGSSHEVDTMVLSLCTALKNIFPSVPLTHIIRKLEIHPPKRTSQLDELERMTLGGCRDIGPCGGFSTQYMCMCDYHALPYREEVAWDVDTIYLSHDTRELYLHDFDYLEQKDLIPIISALEYNTWFRKLRVSHSKLSHEAIDRILHVVSKSLSLEELYLDNIGAKAEFANKLSLALLSNSSIPIQKIDLSHNPLEDKGALHISNPIGRQAKGLGHLNLSCCGLTSKGINMVAHSLNVNKFMCQTLTYLNFSGNSLRDDINNLYNFLAQPNVLKTLDLSATEITIDAVFGPLLRGCTSNLCQLNLSRNGFGSKKSREMLPSFKQYFTSTLALKDIILSHCKLPAEALKNVLLGLACNENISDVELDLCSNQLGATGAQILESCIHGVRCLSSLDISDNCLENQLGPVVNAISKNKSIKKLNIARNLNSIKSKHVYHVTEAIVQMIQEEDCVLESLTINDSRLKSDLHNLLNALGSNHCLQSLDISGNYMGDSGARLLAKALQINSKLQYISYDRNNVTLTGYSDIAYALQSNYTVKFLPFPVHDMMMCMKTAPERTDNIMRKIQDLLYRNVSPIKYSNGQAFRLQQGFLLSSTQQHVDRLVLQTGESARALKRGTTTTSPENVSSLIEWSEDLISDAENSKQLISHLHDVVLRRDETGNPIETRLHQLSQDLHTVITNYLQDNVESMVRSAQDKCPNVLSEEKVVDDIRIACLTKSQLSPQVIEEAIVEQAGSVILNKVNEVNLAVASTVSDRVIDEVVDSLTKTCKNLQSGEGHRKRASTCTDMGARERGSSESSTRSERSTDALSQDDTTSHKSDPSPMATPQLASKRKSIHGRKLRPQSVVAESLDSVSELPSSCGQLQHLGKARPRRPKTRAPTRPMGRADLVEEDHDISEGVDTFFRPGSSTPTTPLVSPDSENSPRLLKYGSTSSMESFPQTSGVRTASDRGSLESLTRSDSIARSESDNNRDSPRQRNRSRDTEDEDLEDDSDRDDKSASVSSLIGRLSCEGGLKLSPDISNRKTSSSSTLSASEANSQAENDLKEDTPKKVASGVSKFGGIGIGGNILAEMKARQEKRSSVIPKENDEKDNDRPVSSGLLGGVKLRSTGFANNLKSPTNGFPRASSKSPTPAGFRDSAIIDSGPTTPSDAPTIVATKVKPPPPLAPKPRPKSTIVGEKTSPGVTTELLHALDKRRSTISNHQMEELEESLVDGENTATSSGKIGLKNERGVATTEPNATSCTKEPTSVSNSDNSCKEAPVGPAAVPAPTSSSPCGEVGADASLGQHLLRQTSHKHVLNTDLVLDDVVNV